MSGVPRSRGVGEMLKPPSEDRGSPGRGSTQQTCPLHRLRGLGLILAWMGAVACGWKVSLQSDLLDAVLRGAAAWLGMVVVWRSGISWCERLIRSLPPQTSRATEHEQA